MCEQGNLDYNRDLIENSLKVFEKRTEEEMSNNEYNINNYKVLRYPRELEDYRIYNRRKAFIPILKDKLKELYDKEDAILQPAKTQSGQIQRKYYFTPSFRNIRFKWIESTCYIVTSIKATETKISYNISRVGDVRFKGELQDIITNLVEKCKEELLAKYEKNINTINSTAFYVSDHKNYGGCTWNCEQILKTCHKPDRAKHILDNVTNNVVPRVCFRTRQVVGQSIIPYIGEEIEKSKELLEDSINDDESFVFDNFFVNKNDTLAGIKKDTVKLDDINFLDLVDNSSCNALLNFNLSYIGVTTSGMNLYLTPTDSIVYCTKANNQNDILNASKFLEHQTFNNESLRNLIEKKKDINLLSNQALLITNTLTDKKPNKKQKRKIQDVKNLKNKKICFDNEEEEDEEELIIEDEGNKKCLEEEREIIYDEARESVYEARRKQMIHEI